MKIFLFLFVATTISFSYDCEDCRRSLRQCKEWADNAARQGRVPKYCNESGCDDICKNEYKKQHGIKTDAEKYADQRFSAEMGHINSAASYYVSLSQNQKKVYDYVKGYLNEATPSVRAQCARQHPPMDEYDMLVGGHNNFAVGLCVIQQLNNINFIKLMNRLQVPESYWDVARTCISNYAADLAMYLY